MFFFEDKMIYEQEGEVPVGEDFTVPIGSAHVEREGEDVTVVATQRLVGESLSTAENLDGEVSVEVIDARSLYPLDTDTIVDSLEKTGRLVVADESPISYGVHAEIAARALEEAFFSLDAPIERVGVPDTHVPFSPPLEEEVLPGEEGHSSRDPSALLRLTRGSRWSHREPGSRPRHPPPHRRRKCE